jgi:hypothetical protein
MRVLFIVILEISFGLAEYLGFFQDAQKAMTHLSSIYGYARENPRSLKHGAYAMEGDVKFFVMHVY